jgi:hypothetical protein
VKQKRPPEKLKALILLELNIHEINIIAAFADTFEIM